MQGRKVQPCEKGLLADLLSLQPDGYIADQALQKLLSFGRQEVVLFGLGQPLGEDDLMVEHLLRHNVRALWPHLAACVESHTATQALEDERPQRPDVASWADLAKHRFRRHVLRRTPRATQALASRPWTVALGGGPSSIGLLRQRVGPAEAKVQELQVALAAQHDIVRLDVAVDETSPVHNVDRLEEFRHVETCLGLGQALLALQVCDEVTALEELHNHVKVILVMEGGQELHEPAVRGLCEDLALAVGALAQVLLSVPRLGHLLQGDVPAIITLPHEVHDSEGAFAKQADRFKVLRRPHLAHCAHEALLLCLVELQLLRALCFRHQRQAGLKDLCPQSSITLLLLNQLFLRLCREPEILGLGFGPAQPIVRVNLPHRQGQRLLRHLGSLRRGEMGTSG
mmetsp:Transcript_2074/g.4636  ORF Transcript_2074/g.4636 Transcript_2074/m.4636 type:complete len:399 (-) Transcript_2074:19-1215(-)